MFEAFDVLFLYTETPLHVGSGRGIGAVDLPIQREVVSSLPMVQGNGVRGPLRAAAEYAVQQGASAMDVEAIFGPDTGNADKHAGALSVGQANLLLFPVRSLNGVFAWVTSIDLLARLQRDLALAGQANAFTLPSEPAPGVAWVTDPCALQVSATDPRIVLEETAFLAKQDQKEAVGSVAEFLRDHALPQTPEYLFWRQSLPGRLCILPSVVVRDYALYSTEIQTHIRLARATKTVEGGMLWTQEALPADCLLYSPLMATAARKPGVTLSGAQVLDAARSLISGRMQIGGDETTGQGRVALKFLGSVNHA